MAGDEASELEPHARSMPRALYAECTDDAGETHWSLAARSLPPLKELRRRASRPAGGSDGGAPLQLESESTASAPADVPPLPLPAPRPADSNDRRGPGSAEASDGSARARRNLRGRRRGR